MWYYYSKKSCNSPRKIRYIRYLIDRTTKRTTRMIIEKRKKRKKNYLHETFHRIRSRQFTKTIKTVPIPYSIKAFHRKIGEEGVEKKNILYTLWTVSAGRGNNISEYENRVEKRWWTKRNWQTTVRTKLCPKGLKLRTTRDRNKQLLSSGSVRVT